MKFTTSWLIRLPELSFNHLKYPHNKLQFLQRLDDLSHQAIKDP